MNPPAPPGPGAPSGEELERVRGALARGAGFALALEDGARAGAGAEGIADLGRRVRADVRGAGPLLQPLLDDASVTDVLVGAGRTWIDRGRGLEEVGAAAMDEAEARALAVRMAAACGRRLDDASPVVDATLPDGTRLNAVLPPLSDDGTLICLRTKRRRAFTLAELVDAGTVAAPLAPVLAGLVRARASCLVTGATGTGKTTLLAALLSLVPPTERIVCIEEASELRPDHPHVIHLQERGQNVQGVGAVTMTALVRTALRMRPDRIVLGECRGPEVRDVLTALNTGHEGGWATLHANSTADVPARLTALGALAGMDETAVAAQAASALDAVVHLRRERTPAGAVRVVASVGVLGRRPGGGELVCEEALRRRPDGSLAEGPAAQSLDALLARDGEVPARRGGPAGSTPGVDAAPGAAAGPGATAGPGAGSRPGAGSVRGVRRRAGAGP